MQATAIPSETIMLRPAAPGETEVVDQVWSTSQDADEPLGRPADGWWSLTSWATTSRVLVTAGAVVGVVAVEYQLGAEAAEARVALLPAHRQRQQMPAAGNVTGRCVAGARSCPRSRGEAVGAAGADGFQATRQTA